MKICNQQIDILISESRDESDKSVNNDENLKTQSDSGILQPSD